MDSSDLSCPGMRVWLSILGLNTAVTQSGRVVCWASTAGISSGYQPLGHFQIGASGLSVPEPAHRLTVFDSLLS